MFRRNLFVKIVLVQAVWSARIELNQFEPTLTGCLFHYDRGQSKLCWMMRILIGFGLLWEGFFVLTSRTAVAPGTHASSRTQRWPLATLPQAKKMDPTRSALLYSLDCGTRSCGAGVGLIGCETIIYLVMQDDFVNCLNEEVTSLLKPEEPAKATEAIAREKRLKER
jgi:hypothetical protein